MDSLRKGHTCLTLLGMLAALMALPALALDITQVARVVASDATGLDMFGRTVALDGDTAIIAAPLDDTGAADSGSVYVFVRNSTGWLQESKLQPTAPLTNGYFGSAVAIDGDTLMIGSPNGRVAFVYVRGASGWTLQQSLTPADSPFAFGSAIALEGDTAIITAPLAVLGSGAYAGAAYVYLRNAAGTWVQQQKLTASDAANNDRFGSSVALHGDTAVFGATDDNDAGNLSGSAYVFVRSSTGVWSQQAKLLASDGLADDRYGISVDVEGDTAVVASFRPQASVYVYSRAGTAWTQQSKLIASDPGLAGTYDVDLQGSILLMSAANDSRAFVFGRSGGSWTQVARLTPIPFGLFFGYSLALDGETALIGAFGDGHAGTFSGSAYLFTLDIEKTPTEQVADMIDVIMSLGLDSGVDTAFLAKLNGSLEAIASGRTGPAVGVLNAFIQSVEAQRGKALTDAQASDLVAAAEELIASLGLP